MTINIQRKRRPAVTTIMTDLGLYTEKMDEIDDMMDFRLECKQELLKAGYIEIGKLTFEAPEATSDTSETVVIDNEPKPEAKKNKLVRANRVTINKDRSGWFANFYRTHKFIKRIHESETSYEKPEGATALLDREQFRQYICSIANTHNINYDPINRQASAIPSKFTGDSDVMEASVNYIETQIIDWIERVEEKKQIKLILGDIIPIEVLPVTERNGGAVNPKYKSGNWAYAQCPVKVILSEVGVDNSEVELRIVTQIVSGQFKKPSMMNGKQSFTYSGLTNILKDEQELRKGEDSDNKDESGEVSEMQ